MFASMVARVRAGLIEALLICNHFKFFRKLQKRKLEYIKLTLTIPALLSSG